MRCPRPAKAERAGLEKVGRSSRAGLGWRIERRPSAVTPSVCAAVEPAAVPFKGKSRAIGGRRLDMGGRGLRRPEGPLVRTPPMLAATAAPEAARSRRFWSTAPRGQTVRGRRPRRSPERISPSTKTAQLLSRQPPCHPASQGHHSQNGTSRSPNSAQAQRVYAKARPCDPGQRRHPRSA